MLVAVDSICPLLTLGSDRHAVCNGFDADHRCGVANGPDPLDRAQQLRFCLGPMHVECPHYARRALSDRAATVDGVPAPSPDVLLAPTRLVIDAEHVRLGLRPGAGLPRGARPVLAAVVVVAATSAGAASGSFQRLAALVGDAGDPVQHDSALMAPTATPAPAASPRAAATAVPQTTPLPTPSPLVVPTPTAAPTSEVMPAQTYVVQAGDTLKAIADRYGTTVAALQQANGIADQNVINVGQVLSIP